MPFTYDDMKVFDKVKKWSFKKRIFMAVVALMITVALVVGNELITISEYEFYSEKIPDGFDGFCIVQISDYHNKQTGLKHLLDKISKQSPDIIVITGDIIDSSKTDVPRAIEMVEETIKIAPVYYITGNHEGRISKALQDELFSGLEGVGAIRLKDETISVFAENGDEITLIGIDGQSSSSELVDIASKTEGFRLALSHYPEDVKEYRDSGVELVLTGHAHGGQVRIPFMNIGLFSPGEGFLPKYTSGLHELGDTSMIVNRGIGNSSIPLRIFNRPEVTVITLSKK